MSEVLEPQGRDLDRRHTARPRHNADRDQHSARCAEAESLVDRFKRLAGFIGTASLTKIGGAELVAGLHVPRYGASRALEQCHPICHQFGGTVRYEAEKTL
jgi:hypothetical protein